MTIKFKHNPHDLPIRITSPFGMRIHPVTGKKTGHNGIDIGAKKAGVQGDPLYAVDDGTVSISKVNGGGVKSGYGYYIKIKHSWGYTLYGHLKSLEVSVGQKVKAGRVIAHMGNTGTSTAAHLHFGVDKTGKEDWVDPKPYLLKEEEDEVTQEQFNAMMETYLTQRKAKPVSGWAAQHWSEATKKDYVDGKAPQGLITREEVATIFNKVLK